MQDALLSSEDFYLTVCTRIICLRRFWRFLLFFLITISTLRTEGASVRFGPPSCSDTAVNWDLLRQPRSMYQTQGERSQRPHDVPVKTMPWPVHKVPGVCVCVAGQRKYTVMWWTTTCCTSFQINRFRRTSGRQFSSRFTFYVCQMLRQRRDRLEGGWIFQ